MILRNLALQDVLVETPFTTKFGNPAYGGVAAVQVDPNTFSSGSFPLTFSGSYVTGLSANLTLNLRLGASVGGTLIYTSFLTFGSTNHAGSFSLDANFMYNAASQNLGAKYDVLTSDIAGNLGAIGPISVASVSDLVFVLTAQFSSNDPANIVTIDSFSVQ